MLILMGCTGLNLPTVALQEGDGYRLEILAVNTESFFKACWGAKQLLPLAGRLSNSSITTRDHVTNLLCRFFIIIQVLTRPYHIGC